MSHYDPSISLSVNFESLVGAEKHDPIDTSHRYAGAVNNGEMLASPNTNSSA